MRETCQIVAVAEEARARYTLTLMKITDTGAVKPNFSVKRRNVGGTGGMDFADFLASASAEDAGEAPATSAASATADVGGMLMLQEVSDEELRRERIVREGESMLDSLEKLRQALLMGQLPLDVLRTLEDRLKRQRERAFDPRLIEIIDDIELRAAVELAKIEVALERQERLVDRNS